MKRLSNVIWGVVLVAVGVIFGLNALDITNVNVFFDGWWTMFIIIPCFVGLFKSNKKTANLIGLLIGVVLLLSNQGFFSLRVVWKLLIPTIIVVIGLRLIFRDFFTAKASKIRKSLIEKNGEIKDYAATFSSKGFNFNREYFQGAGLTAVFGSITCDLRDAIITEDTVVSVCCIFGSADILLPENVNVKVNTDAIFGGVSNKHKTIKAEKVPTVYIDGSCIFGGANIK